MSYTVLARKYRSQTFDEVIGQDPIAQTLKNAIKTGRVAHAYLFTGTRGVGKTTMARVLAKSLNCLSADAPTIEPCCKCDSCTTINSGEDIDVIEIDGASNNGVEEVRRLRENAIYRPARCRYKIYIIDEVHMLSTSAFNALLKILEEPPSHVKFIFATTEPNKVIATIQSRCQRFDFNNISPRLIADQLKSILRQEKIEYEEDLILPLAKMANGSMRDGLSLLDRLLSTGVTPLTAELLEQYLGCPNSEKVYNLIGQIGDSDAAGTLTALQALINSGVSEVQVVDSLVDYMRDLLVAKNAGPDTDLLILTAEQRARAGELAEKFDSAALIYNITALEKLRWSIKNSDTPRALLEASLLRFALSEHFLNVDELLRQAQSGSSSTVKKKALVGTRTERTGKPETDSRRPSSIEPPTTSREQRPATDWPPPTDKEQPPSTEPLASSAETRDTRHEIRDIAADWQDILALIADRLGPGTAGLLRSAVPIQFQDSTLTVQFGPSAAVYKKMCESSGRIEQIESLLSEHFGGAVRLRLETADEQEPKEAAANQPESPRGRKNEIINDPAVKTVLLGLDATITGIEED